MAKEQTFWEYIRGQLTTGWHLQRIETTTGSGVPDLIACYRRTACYIELKALPHTQLKIRNSQLAWMLTHSEVRCNTFILNFCAKSQTVGLWDCPTISQVSTPAPLRICYNPRWIVDKKNFKKEIENDFSRRIIPA